MKCTAQGQEVGTVRNIVVLAVLDYRYSTIQR
jgi:hypothetical protein